MKRKVISSIVFSILLLAFANLGVFAVNNTGIVNFKAIASNGEKVSNLEVNIYKVASIELPNTNVEQTFNGFDIDDVSEANIANMQKYAENNVTPVLTKITDVNGEFTLNLDTGKYLLVQNNKKDDCTMQTMYISVPEITKDHIDFEITAKPKISIVEKVEKDVVEIEEEVLPQTGILDWPIAALLVGGIAIFSVSWIIFYTKKKIR